MPLLLFTVCVLGSSAALGNDAHTSPSHVDPGATLEWPNPAVVPGGLVGTLPGSGGVEPDGQYHYSLPLEVPPGRAGMQPSLSLVYGSGGGNGIAGVGFQLGGVSTIHQCPKTHAVDGVAQPVDPGRLAAMCLDGARLIKLSGGGVDAPVDGSVYRTENDNFARIVFHGDLENLSFVPYFEVWARDGLILRYQTLDQNHSIYPLRRVQDRSGNTVHYEYAYDGGTWVYPVEIQYTGRYDENEDKLLPDSDYVPDRGKRSVILRYEDRADHVVDRVGGIAHTIAKRLSSIEMHAPAPSSRRLLPSDEGTQATTSLVWTYTLDYGAPSPGTAASILRSVRRTGALGGRAYAKEFHWRSAGPSPGRSLSWIPGAGVGLDVPTFAPFHPTTVDVDGDGRDEVAVELSPGDIRLLSTLPGAGGVLNASGPLLGLKKATLVDARFGDVDGDGVPELFAPDRAPDAEGFRYYRLYRWSASHHDYVDASPGTPFETYVDGHDTYPQENPLFLVDLDGDGRPDLVKADHALDDPYLDESRKDVHQPVGVVFTWSRRHNDGGVFGPREVFFDPGAANAKVNVLATPTSGSPFAAFGVSDGSGAARLLAMNTWVAFGVHNWHQDHPGAVDVEEPYARPAATWQPLAHSFPFAVDISGDTGVPGLTTSASTGPWDWFVALQGDAFASATSWLCGIGNFDGQTPEESYCVDPGEELPGTDADPTHWRVRTADLDGDGRDDLITYHVPPGVDPALFNSFFSDRAYRIWFDAAAHKHVEPLSVIPVVFADLDGDGKTDILGGTAAELAAHTVKVYLGDTQSRDLMDEVWDEAAPRAGERVTYADAWRASSSTCSYPLHCLRRGLTLVESHAVYQGAEVDQYRTRWFGFDDPRYDVRGRGFLGFTQVREWDPDRPSETVTFYDNRTSDGGVYYALLPRLVLHYVPIQPVASAGHGGEQPVNVRVTQSRMYYAIDRPNAGKTFFRHPTSWLSSESESTATLDWSPSAPRHFKNFGPPTLLRERNGTYEFDAVGNLTHQHEATIGGNTTDVSLTYEYRYADWLVGLVQGRHTTSSSAGGTPSTRHVFYAYDTRGQVEDVQVALYDSDPDVPETTWFGRNADGLVTDTIRYAAGETPRGAHVEYDPDEGIFPRRVWNDLGHTTQLLYHPAFGGLADAFDPNGVEAQVVYDDLGRVRETRRAGGMTVLRDYVPRLNGAHEVIGTVVYQNGAGVMSSITGLDMRGRPVIEHHAGFDGSWIASRTSYDVLGRAVFRSRPAWGSPAAVGTTYTYDSLDRLRQTKLPDDTAALAWHSFRESHAVDPAGHESYVVRDVDGRTVESVQTATGPSPVRTRYAYGAFDELRSVIDPAGNVTSISYDQRGRRKRVLDPDTGLTAYDYNGFGEVTDVWTESPSGAGPPAHTTHKHDVLGRVYETAHADGATTRTTSFTWDASPHGRGRLSAAAGPDGIEQRFTYDSHGRLHQQTWKVGDEELDFLTGYDALGRLSTIAYPDVLGGARFTVEREYKSSGYLESVSEVGSTGRPFWQVLDRDADGHLRGGALGNGLFEHRTYDDTTGRLLGIIDNPWATTLSSPVFSVGYEYTLEGLVKKRTDHVAQRTETFDHDPLHRLEGWTLDQPGKATDHVGYSYDLIGNLLTVSTNGVTAESDVYGCYGVCQASTIKPHALAATVVGGGPVKLVNPFTHDARGRQTAAPGRKVTFTEQDLPRTVTTASGTTTFQYDAAGARVSKVGPDGSTVLSLGGLYERRQAGNATQHVFYVPGTDGMLAQVVRDPLVGSSVEYIHRDRLGSAAAVSDATGQITSRMFYDPFGARVEGSGPGTLGSGDVRVGFTGDVTDPEVGLVDMRGRVYDPKIRHFLSADPFVTAPLNAQSYNRYSYVLNNPVNLVDPSGFEPWWPDSGMSYDPSLWDNSCYDPYYGGTSSVHTPGPSEHSAYDPYVKREAAPPPPQKVAAQQGTPTYQATPMPAVPSGPTGQAWRVVGSGGIGGASPGLPSEDGGGGLASQSGAPDLGKVAVHVLAEIVGRVCLVSFCQNVGGPDNSISREIRQRQEELAREYPMGLPILAVTGRGGGAVAAYEVGTFDELKARSTLGDALDLHHVGQAHAMEQIVPGYSRTTGPAIALPRAEHAAVPTLRGPVDVSPRSLLARDIWNLRRYTNAPSSSLLDLIRLNKKMYPEALTK